MKTSFQEVYSMYTTSQLVELLDHEESYQPEAVAIAREEFQRRNLTEVDIAEARRVIAEAKINPYPENKRFERLIKKISQPLPVLLNLLDPTKPKSAQQGIYLLCLLFGVVFVRHVISNAGFIWLMLSDFFDWDASVVIWVLPYIFIPLMLSLLLRRVKAGLVMLNIGLIHTIIGNIFMGVQDLRYREPATDGLAAFLDQMVPSYGIGYYIGVILISAGLLSYINTKAVRVLFKMDKIAVVIAVGTGLLLGILTFS